jgi:CO dehydrogenase maturation factor
MDKLIFGVTGKGGTGKTAIVTIMAKILVQKYRYKILVIDADSAVSLPLTMGIKIDKTVSDIRSDLITDPEMKKKIAQKHIGDAIKEIIVESKGLNLLAMGRPEAAGCFCHVNDLLKYGIETVTKDYQITIIDCEAGPEQINRRVVQDIDHLIIVADMSARSLNTANSIHNIAKSGAIKGTWNVGLVINKLKETDINTVTRQASEMTGLNILGCIPEDRRIVEFDLKNKPLLDLPDDSPSIIAMSKVIEQMGFKEGE